MSGDSNLYLFSCFFSCGVVKVSEVSFFDANSASLARPSKYLPFADKLMNQVPYTFCRETNNSYNQYLLLLAEAECTANYKSYLHKIRYNPLISIKNMSKTYLPSHTSVTLLCQTEPINK